MPLENTSLDPSGNTTCSGRSVKLTPRMAESMLQRDEGIVAWEILLDQSEEEDQPVQEQQYELQQKLDNPIAFMASTDPDTMYYHQAMKEPNREHFKESVHKKIEDHEHNHHWEITLIEDVPKDTNILDMVWSMRRKR